MIYVKHDTPPIKIESMGGGWWNLAAEPAHIRDVQVVAVTGAGLPTRPRPVTVVEPVAQTTVQQ